MKCPTCGKEYTDEDVARDEGKIQCGVCKKWVKPDPSYKRIVAKAMGVTGTIYPAICSSCLAEMMNLSNEAAEIKPVENEDRIKFRKTVFKTEMQEHIEKYHKSTKKLPDTCRECVKILAIEAIKEAKRESK